MVEQRVRQDKKWCSRRVPNSSARDKKDDMAPMEFVPSIQHSERPGNEVVATTPFEDDLITGMVRQKNDFVCFKIKKLIS